MRALVVLVLALLGGCALAPPPPPEEIRAQALPHLALPATWTASGTTSTAAPAIDWLDSFQSAELKALVDEALAWNLDLALAAARVEQAAAYAKAAGAGMYPAVDLLARGGGKLGGDGSGLNGIGLSMSWELDVWGRVRAEREVGRWQLASAQADQLHARQSIAALVAKSWLLAIEARLQRGIAAGVVRDYESVLSLTQDRYRIGSGDAYDVAQAEAHLHSYRDASRQLLLAEEQALRSLEVLLGRYPAGRLEIPQALPALPPPVPVGLPSDLLERRPDVTAAERRVAAAFNRVEEAKAARLPRIALTAGLSSVSSDLFVLQQNNNPVASLGANLMAPIFHGYALQANVEIRTAEQKIAVAEYGRIGARAFAEVESALAAGFAADERAAILGASIESNARALQLAQVRLRVGSGDLRAVLQQNVALYGARTAQLRAQTDRLVQRVNLHLALGGGFEPSPQPPVAAAPGNDDSAVLHAGARSR